MTPRQLLTWQIDRQRQANLFAFSYPAPWCRGESFSRGEWLRRANNGLALRTFRAVIGKNACTHVYAPCDPQCIHCGAALPKREPKERHPWG